MLAGHQYRLARDQELLLDGHRRLADAQAQFGTGMNGSFPAHLVSVVSARAEISELSAALANAARKDWMTLENLHTEMPLTDDFAQPPLPASGGRVRCRSIYAAGAMEHPIARRIIQASAEAGSRRGWQAVSPVRCTPLADRPGRGLLAPISAQLIRPCSQMSSQSLAAGPPRSAGSDWHAATYCRCGDLAATAFADRFRYSGPWPETAPGFNRDHASHACLPSLSVADCQLSVADTAR